MPTALILATNGSEEMELLITSDVLRRAGVEVTIAGLKDEKTIICARKASLNVDKLLSEVSQSVFDAVILPGGQPGSDTLAQDKQVGEVLRVHHQAGKIIAAICAAPLALKSHNIAKGATITSYPAVRGKLEDEYTYVEDDVCVWNNVVTSRGPGTAFAFGLKLVELLVSAEASDTVKKALLLSK